MFGNVGVFAPNLRSFALLSVLNFSTVSLMTMHYLYYGGFGSIREGYLIHCELFACIVEV